jgi:hypothetical protein
VLSQQFKNVQGNCRIKFHLYDYDFGPRSDDTIGIVEMDSLDQFLREGAPERTLPFGKKGKSRITVRVAYV